MIDIRYDQNRDILNISVSGTSDFNEFNTTFETITNSKDYSPNVRAVWDIRKADLTFANFQLVQQIVKLRSGFTKRENCRSALIVSCNYQYGLGRMFEMLSEGKIPHQLMVFRDYNEGEQWLLEN